MALLDKDKEWIRNEIKISLDGLKPHGWARAVRVLRELGPLISIISTVLTLVGITFGALYYSFTRVDKEARFETNTTRSIDDINSHLKSIDGQMAKQRVEAVASLTPSEFKANLSEVNASIATVREQKVTVSASVIGNLQKNLIATDDKSPGYWPAVAQLISYRSGGISLSQDASVLCGTSAAPGSMVITGGPASADMLGEASFSNCTLDLDQPDAWTSSKSAFHVEAQDGGLVSNWHLKLHNVIVHYSGVPLTHVSEIAFDHCIFDFQFSQPLTSPPGRSMTSQLLASANPDNIEVHLENLSATHS